MATTIFTANGYGSPVQQEYDQMVAQKRSAEMRYRQSIDDPELRARLQSASNHLNIGSTGQSRSISAPQDPYIFKLPPPQSSMSADYFTNAISLTSQVPTYNFNDPLTFERSLKDNERQRKLKYLSDLQRQAEEQRQKREREKRQAQQAIHDPPWLRGNPQPTTGVRGTAAWTAGQQTTTIAPESMRRERSLPPDFRLGQPSFPIQQQRNIANYSVHNAPNHTIQNHQDSNYRDALQRQIQERELERQKKRLDEERYNKRLEQEAQVYDPFGKGGGGAPIRDEQGHVIADRGKLLANAYKGQANKPMHKNDMPVPPPESTDALLNHFTFDALQSSFNALNKSLSVSQPNLAAASFNTPAATTPNGPQGPKDEYRESLRQQIEEKKQQQALEKQREKEIDERERKKFEAYQQRLQDEIEAEKAKHRRRLELAKAQQEFTLKAHEAFLNESQRPKGKSENPTIVIPKSAKRAAVDDGLEWWERQGKQSDHIRRRSSTLPAQTRANEPETLAATLNPRIPSSTNRPKTPPATEAWASAPQQPIADGEEAPDTPPVRRNFKPRSGAIRNEDVMRQLSAMRERLNKEQNRVQSALNHRDYNEGVFDGDRDAIPPVDAMLRQRDELDTYVREKGIRLDRDQPRHRIYLREHSDFDIHMPPEQRGNYYPPPPKNSLEPYFDRYGKPVIPTANGQAELKRGSPDDAPLVRLIKNSRTSLQSAYPPLRQANPYPSQPYGTHRVPRYHRLNRSMSIETLDADNPQYVVDDYLYQRDLRPRRDRRLFDRVDSSDSLYR